MTELEVNHPSVNQTQSRPACLISSLPQEAHYEVQCSPLTRKVCAAVPSFVTRQEEKEEVCETQYETVCTTIIATKYVKVWCHPAMSVLVDTDEAQIKAA